MSRSPRPRTRPGRRSPLAALLSGLGGATLAVALTSPVAAAPVAVPPTTPVVDPATPLTEGSWVVLTRDADDRRALLAEVAADPTYVYGSAVDGFAATLDGPTVDRLAGDERVVRLEPVERQRLASTGAPRLTADARGDLPGLGTAWDNVGGSTRAGAGTVVGVVDSGLWPESPVFAPEPAQSGARARFGADCQAGAAWEGSRCNDKVVGARWFVDGFGRDDLSSSETLSPRDVVGHGTEVAALAVGNADVPAAAEGADLGRVSGTAPAASVAVYKACWTAPDPERDGCATSDVVAALDAAVADGVDVVVYGAAGTRAGDAVSRALLGARTAGVVPVTPAGNDAAVEDGVPWGLAVGASRTLTRPGAVELVGGRRFQGTMVAEGLTSPAPLLRAAQVGAAGARVADARACRADSLDPEEVRGAVVVCDRGGNARVEKSAEVAAAGGTGMVLLNVADGPDDTPADLHTVPTVHLALEEARDLRAALSRRPDARARLDPLASAPVAAPVLADFSARTLAGGDGPRFLGADVLAPGVDLLTATSAAGGTPSWGFVSGTSVAAARVAGTAALLLGDRPGRSVDEVVSSIVSTAYQVLGDGSPLAQGNGLVDPSRVLNPGLAVSATSPGFTGFLRGDRPAQRVHTPSLVLGDVTGPVRVVRTLRNLSGDRASWDFTATGVAGYRVRANPSSVTLAPGERVDVRLRVVPVPGSTDWVGGRLEWRSTSQPDVRLPLALRSSELAPARAPRPRSAVGTAVSVELGPLVFASTTAPVPR